MTLEEAKTERLRYLFPWFPPCKAPVDWLCPLAKVHSSCGLGLYPALFPQVRVTAASHCPFGQRSCHGTLWLLTQRYCTTPSCFVWFSHALPTPLQITFSLKSSPVFPISVWHLLLLSPWLLPTLSETCGKAATHCTWAHSVRSLVTRREHLTKLNQPEAVRWQYGIESQKLSERTRGELKNAKIMQR